MRVCSLRDLMLADTLSHFKNEITLVHPDNDEVVVAVLEQLGFDVTLPHFFIASKHRDMQNKVAIGLQVVGEFSRDPKYRHFLDTTDRVIVAGLSDASLAREMCELLGKKHTYRSDDRYGEGKRNKPKDDVRYYSQDELDELGFDPYEEKEDEFAGDYLEDGWEQATVEITQLQAIVDDIRKGV